MSDEAQTPPAPNKTQQEVNKTLNDIGEYYSEMNVYYTKTVNDVMSRIMMPHKPLAPVPDAVTTAVAEIISKGIEGGGSPADSRVNDIVWGWPTEGVADRLTAVYYRLNVTESQAQLGFSLHCRSKNRSKLRVFVYDKNGILVDKADAFRTMDKTLSQVVMLFSNEETLKMESQPEDSVTLALTNSQKSPARLFSKLDGLVPNGATKLQPVGPYLIAVYIDNALLPGPFSLVALPTKQGDEMAAVLHADKSIADAKERMSQLALEYAHTKAAYEATLAKMKEEDDISEALLQSREVVYRNYLVSCGSAYSTGAEPEHSATVEFDEFGGDTRAEKPPPSPAIDAQKILKAASTHVSQGSVWLASRFASGFSQLHKATTSNENASVTSSLEGHYAETEKGEVEEEEEPPSGSPSSTPAPAEQKKATATTAHDAIDHIFDEVTADQQNGGTAEYKET